MKRIDVKHIAYHVLVGLYFVWFVVFGALIALALINAIGHGNYGFTRVFVLWIFFNLITGTVLFIVIRLFRKRNILSRVILYTYFFMAAATVTTMLIIRNT